MVRTFGLTHIALAVRDTERSCRFYQDLLGAIVVYRQDGFVQLQTPGTRDVIVLEASPEHAGPGGGMAHFGFRLTNPADIDEAHRAVEHAGGTVRQRGEFVPGEPYLFVIDPDGYELEIWYELPTPVDPPNAAETSEHHAAFIRALDDAWSAAAARHDLDGMMAIYASDAQELMPAMQPMVGREAIRAFYRDLIERLPRFAHAFQQEEIIVAESGDLAVVRGSYRFTPDTLQPAEIQRGKFVGVWRRSDGEWRLQMNISNSDPQNHERTIARAR